jgi:hypothetical protein
MLDTSHLLPTVLLGYRWLDLRLWTLVALDTGECTSWVKSSASCLELAAFVPTPALFEVLAHGTLVRFCAAYTVFAGRAIIAGQALGEAACTRHHYIAQDPDPLQRVDVYAVFTIAS